MRPIAFGCQFGAIRNSVAPFAIAISKRLATGEDLLLPKGVSGQLPDCRSSSYDLRPLPGLQGLGVRNSCRARRCHGRGFTRARVRLVEPGFVACRRAENVAMVFKWNPSQMRNEME